MNTFALNPSTMSTDTKHISILALKNANIASIADARMVFLKANEILKASKQKKMFEVKIIGTNPETYLSDNLFMIKPDAITSQVKKTDLIIIPALNGDMMTATHNNRFYVDWIIRQYKRNAEIASLCTGAFMLAFSGLLRDKKCTTHWQYANEFRHFYPDVELIDEKIIVEHNGLYSSGGSNAYWNLLLFLVEKFVNRETAIQIAKYFVVNLDKVQQTPFIIFNGLKDHHDAEVLKAQEYIEQNYPRKITVDELATSLHLTRRSFERRFKKVTHCSVIEYLQKVRIEASKKELEAGRKPIDEILLEVGYSDPQAFREIFKRITGTTPIEYKNKYTKPQ
ncbi:GlxA family transcriptional regulator [Flavihumibacter solisilvae]|nr:helix-turn-helix domain-containing protein [Flavihumibacter solisilvae]